MNFSHAIQSVFANVKNYSGRAPRSEFWYWLLFTYIVSLVAAIPVVMVAMVTSDIWMLMPFLIAWGALSLTLFVLTINVTVRRLHDQGLSGWFYLLFLIPTIGGLIELILMVQPSKPEKNQWGPPYRG